MGLRRLRHAALTAALLAVAAGCSQADVVAEGDALAVPAAVTRTDGQPPADPTPVDPTPAAETLPPFERLDCPGDTALGLDKGTRPLPPDGRTAEEALAAQLDEINGWGREWSALPTLSWQRRALARPPAGPPSQAQHAVFVGTRPDGGEHASIRMSGSPTYAWYAHSFKVCT